MKELSIKEKAKRYDEAIEKAGKIHNEHKAQPFDVMLKVFSELRESEDERIRKDIIWCLKHSGIKESNSINPHVTTTAKDAIAWLEKQINQNLQGKTALEAIKEEKVDNQNCAKPDDKVEPKQSDEHYELEEFAKIIRCNLTSISKAVRELFEDKYIQLTGNKMYGGFKD